MHEIDNIYFEVGAARSGTMFLGRVLSSHPMIAHWDRPNYILRHGNAWKPDDCLRKENATPRVKRYIRRRFHEYWKASGREGLLVTSQACVLAMDFVNEVFPNVKFIHIYRDGREVASSQKGKWATKTNPGRIIRDRLPGVPITDMPAYAGEFLALVFRRVFGGKPRVRFGPRITDWKRLSGSLDRLQFTARTWAGCVRAARRVGMALPKERYYEVRFEDLLRDPAGETAKLLEFMELPPSTEVAEYIKENVVPSMSGKWLKNLTEAELDLMMPEMRDLLEELGYEV